MGILDRATSIIMANINDLLDKAEDPAKMVDQYLIELTDNLDTVRHETAGILAEEARMKRLVEENNAQIERMEPLARKALEAGNEDDARAFLAKKRQLEERGEELATSLEAATANATKMRELHDKLVSDINEVKKRREAIRAKVAVAKTQDRVAQLSSNFSKAEGALAAFDRMEEKADRMLDASQAYAELGATPSDPIDALETKYSDAVKQDGVEDDLARLKSEMGL